MLSAQKIAEALVNFGHEMPDRRLITGFLFELLKLLHGDVNNGLSTFEIAFQFAMDRLEVAARLSDVQD
jgi:hypothetical protein